jgi:hypothetical protein
MIRIVTGLLLLAVLPQTGFCQPYPDGAPFPNGRYSYSSTEEYCRENPKMPTCFNGKPLAIGNGLALPDRNYRVTPITPGPSGLPSYKAAPAAPQAGRTPAPETVLLDWRFSHPMPAMLISINIGSLLQSPMWASFFSSLGAGGAELQRAALEKARSALSDVGQILVSLSLNGTKNPSLLVMAKGNMDGAVGAWLRSSPETQIKRIDAITTLLGDTNSLAFANMRMQAKTQRTTFNPLQQTATREALKYDAWVGVDPRQMGSLASAMGGKSSQALAMLANLRGISVGVYLREQLRMEAVLETPSPDMAARMLAMYQQQAKPGKDEGQIWAVTEGANLRFTEIVDASHLKGATELDPAVAQMIGPQIASLMQSLTGSKPQSASAAAPASTPKASPGRIVIQGLDGGPKVLPVK